MDLERLLDPTTTPAQRQILLSNLLNANTEIQASVQKALRDRQVGMTQRLTCLTECIDVYYVAECATWRVESGNRDLEH